MNSGQELGQEPSPAEPSHQPHPVSTFETTSGFVVLAGLELTVEARLASGLQPPSLCFPSSGTVGV